MNGSQEHERYITFHQYLPISSGFCNKWSTWSCLQKTQKSKNMTMISFEGHDGMARISWSSWNSHTLTRKSVNNSEVPIALTEFQQYNVVSFPVAVKGHSSDNVASLTMDQMGQLLAELIHLMYSGPKIELLSPIMCAQSGMVAVLSCPIQWWIKSLIWTGKDWASQTGPLTWTSVWVTQIAESAAAICFCHSFLPFMAPKKSILSMIICSFPGENPNS